MKAQLTAARVQQLADSIKEVGDGARKADAEKCGRLSYPYMCGGLQVLISALVSDLAGSAAADLINSAFDDAYRVRQGEQAAEVLA